MNHLEVTIVSAFGGVAAGTKRYFLYPQEQDCLDAQVTFLGLTPAQKIAQTVAVKPAPDDNTFWKLRGCTNAATGTITQLSCAEVGSQTIITVTGTVLNQVNIQAVSGGAQWGDEEVWYDTTQSGGAPPPGQGSYQKVWTFKFVPGNYLIRARRTGSTDATQYVSFNFVAGSGVTSVAVTEVGTTTVMTVTATTANEINIVASGAGASWGSPNDWYPTTKLSGGDPPAVGIYQKVWPFRFVAGPYHVQARTSGTADASKYKSTDFTATANSNNPPSGGGGGSTATIDEALGQKITYSNTARVGTTSQPDWLALRAEVGSDGLVRAYNTKTYPGLDANIRARPIINGIGYLSDADQPGYPRGFPIDYEVVFVNKDNLDTTTWTDDHVTISGFPHVQGRITL